MSRRPRDAGTSGATRRSRPSSSSSSCSAIPTATTPIRGPVPVPEERVGDLALTFDPAPPGRSRGGAPWALAAEEGNGRLWTTAPTAAWRGHSVTWDRGEHGLRVTLGHRPE